MDIPIYPPQIEDKAKAYLRAPSIEISVGGGLARWQDFQTIDGVQREGAAGCLTMPLRHLLTRSALRPAAEANKADLEEVKTVSGRKSI